MPAPLRGRDPATDASERRPAVPWTGDGVADSRQPRSPVMAFAAYGSRLISKLVMP
jgi:hypothetical protein